MRIAGRSEIMKELFMHHRNPQYFDDRWNPNVWTQLFHILGNDASSVPGPCLLPVLTWIPARRSKVREIRSYNFPNSTRACDDIHVIQVRKQVLALLHLITDLL